MKKINLALIIGIILAFTYSFINASAADIENITESVVRLHILANSDSEEDQNLKLKVRDRILLEVGAELSSDSRLGAEAAIVESMDRIQAIAQNTVYENGYNYKVSCELVHMYFDERKYGNLTMPAGDYDALRIYIGEAKGKNWWCVLFPKLCIGASVEIDKVFIEDTKFSDEEIIILEKPEKVKYKFKCYEWVKAIGHFFRQ